MEQYNDRYCECYREQEYDYCSDITSRFTCTHYCLSCICAKGWISNAVCVTIWQEGYLLYWTFTHWPQYSKITSSYQYWHPISLLHAQAEALVQCAQQPILAIEVNNLHNLGRLPHSAKLAAYGKSLAMERWLKEVEQGNTGADVEKKEVDGWNSSSAWELCKSSSPCMWDVRALDVPKWGMNPSRSHIRQPQRPSTSESGAFSN